MCDGNSHSLKAMPKLPGLGQKGAIRGLQKPGFVIVRESGHIILEKGNVMISVPRHAVINAHAMGNIAKNAGLTPRQFRELL